MQFLSKVVYKLGKVHLLLGGRAGELRVIFPKNRMTLPIQYTKNTYGAT